MFIVLKKPIITEKSMDLARQGLYTFMVEKGATKPQIAQAVASQFGVKVIGVRTINVKGKAKMQRRLRKFYLLAGFKKALVQVKKGQTIPLFETPKEETEVVSTPEGEPIVLKKKKDLLGRTKVRVEKEASVQKQTTPRKVIGGK